MAHWIEQALTSGIVFLARRVASILGTPQEKLKDWRAKLKHDVSDETCGSGSGSNSKKIPQGDMRRQEQTKAARTLALALGNRKQQRKSTSDSQR